MPRANGDLVISIGVLSPAEWLALQDQAPHLLATLDYLFAHHRVPEAIACIEDHLARTSYARRIVEHPETADHCQATRGRRHCARTLHATDNHVFVA